MNGATAIRILAVASDARLSNPSHGTFLPTSWRTLYDLTTLSDEQFEEALDADIIRPDMERKDLAPIKAKARQLKNGAGPAESGGNITDLLALVAAGRKFGCIYADPPWLYGNQGTRAATSNQYEGLPPWQRKAKTATRDIHSFACWRTRWLRSSMETRSASTQWELRRSWPRRTN